jgi:hypothetical protein
MNGDVYYYPDAGGNTSTDARYHNHTQPILGITSDTFWFFTTGQRATYGTALGWNDCLAKNFPDVFRRLAGVQ